MFLRFAFSLTLGFKPTKGSDCSETPCCEINRLGAKSIFGYWQMLSKSGVSVYKDLVLNSIFAYWQILSISGVSVYKDLALNSILAYWQKVSIPENALQYLEVISTLCRFQRLEAPSGLKPQATKSRSDDYDAVD